MSDAFTHWTRAQSVCVTASEGGIDYWAADVAYLKTDASITLRNVSVDAFISNLRGITFTDAESDGKRYSVSTAEIERAIKRIEDDHSLCAAHIRRYIAEDDIDADAADVIVQIAAFGKLVYG